MFVPGADPAGPIDLPSEEVDKLRKVLRLSPGAIIGVLPNDGSIIRCEFQNRVAVPIDVHRPEVEAKLQLTIAQALPKGEKLDEIVRACTEIGVAHFTLFPSERTVVKWDDKKVADRLRRLQIIAREASELSFRTRIPTFAWAKGLKEVLEGEPEAVVLSEVEGVSRGLERSSERMTVVVGPEGGWAPREVAMIADRGVTLGPRVLRVDHAAPAAAAILLLGRS
ncbi:MAG: rRNA (uracil1498-N3)-methyltransferase [Fimbriimonadaceae bacterium]|nr:rRNA (uracil1498-N3)-methyltransferase [Fimbriimonadaceae bacterium]